MDGRSLGRPDQRALRQVGHPATDAGQPAGDLQHLGLLAHGGEHLLALLPQREQRAPLATEFELQHDLFGQGFERLPLHRGQRVRRHAQQRQGAEGAALGRTQRHAAVKAQVRRAVHQRVLREARILRQVGHHCRAGLPHADRAEAQGQLELRDVQTDRGLEPLAVVVDQADQRDRHLAQLGRQLHQLVELGFRGGVEHGIAAQRLQALRFGQGLCRVCGHAAAGGVGSRGVRVWLTG